MLVSGAMAKRSTVIWIATAALATAACKGKKEDTTPKNASGAAAKVDPTLCEESGKRIETFDLNKDGKPDVWRLYAGDTLTCKQDDFDHDGRKDWVVAYNRKGAVLFEKADFDYDGRFDMSAIYDVKTGKIVEVERDSDFDGKYDLKELYDTAGQLTSVHRDRDGSGAVDLWEQYRDGKLIAILYDDDGDTKVDRREDVPGSREKVEMPDVLPTASGDLGGTTDDKTPAPTPKSK